MSPETPQSTGGLGRLLKALPYVLLVAAIFWVYAPVYTYRYDFHDAFFVFLMDDGDPCIKRPLFNAWIVDGRALFAFLNCYGVTIWLKSVGMAWLFRLIAVVVLAISACLLGSTLRREGLGRVTAFALAFGAMTLPGMQGFASASHAMELAFAPLVTILAFRCVRAWMDARGSKRMAAAGWFAGAIVLVVASLLIYQQTTPLLLALFVPALMGQRPSRPALRRFLAGVSAFGVACVLYLAIHKLITIPLLQWAQWMPPPIPGDPRLIKPSFDLAAKLPHLPPVVQNALGLWNVDYSGWFLAAVAVIYLGALIGCLVLDVWSLAREGPPETPSALLGTYGALLVLPPMVSVVVMAAPQVVAFYRVIFPLQVVILLVIGVGAGRVVTALGAQARTWAVALQLIGCLLITANVHHNLERNLAIPNWKEFEFIRAELVRQQCQLPAVVYVIRPDRFSVGDFTEADSFPRLADEFGRISTMFPQDALNIVMAVLKDLGLPKTVVVRVDSVEGAPSREDAARGVVIDMRQFVRLVDPEPSDGPLAPIEGQRVEDTTSRQPVLVQEGVPDGRGVPYNIIQYGDMYYGVPQSAGAFAPNLTTPSKRQDVFAGSTKDAVTCQISSDAPKVIERGFVAGGRRYNILSSGRMFYAVPETVDATQPIHALHRESFIGISADDVKRHIWRE